MSCPTCDHTMHQIGGPTIAEGFKTFWCPRCGTVRRERTDNGPAVPDSIHVPKLVERCRAFERGMIDGREEGGRVGIADWKRLGIAESINPPDRRPT